MDKLAEILIKDKWLTLEQLALARQEAKRLDKSLWAALVKLGIFSQEDIAIFFAQESSIPYVRISDYQITDEVIGSVNEEFCRENLIFPLFKIQNVLFIACANPLDTTVIDRLITRTGYEIEPLISNAQAITQAQDQYFGLEDRFFDFHKFVLKRRPVIALPFCRLSKRIPINLPVWLTIENKEFLLHYSSQIEGVTKDISRGGTAIGLNIFLFIPKGIVLTLEFKSDKKSSIKSGIKVKGEVVYCSMEKEKSYLLGVKFVGIDESTRKRLVDLAKQTPSES